MADIHPIPTDRRFIDLTGRTFGELTVESYAGKRGIHPYWNCQCSCGKVKVIAGTSLKRGASSSCGCVMKAIVSRMKTTHGNTKGGHSLTYRCWLGMRRRCYDPNCGSYGRYGAKGVAVCERWRNSFDAFLEDMGPKPSPKHQIDRIDNSKGYEPGNCRWSTLKQQAQNRCGVVRLITHKGTTLCIMDWASRLGLNRNTIALRLKKGWPLDRVLSPK